MQSTSANLQSKRTGLAEPTNKIDSKSTTGTEKQQQAQPANVEAMQKVLDQMSAEKKAVESKVDAPADSEVKDQKVNEVTEETARLSIEDKPTAESAKAISVDPATLDAKKDDAPALEDAAKAEPVASEQPATAEAVTSSDEPVSSKKRSFDQISKDEKMADQAEGKKPEEGGEAPIETEMLASPTKRLRVEEPIENPALMQPSAPEAEKDAAKPEEPATDKIEEGTPSMLKDIPDSKVQEALNSDAIKQPEKIEEGAPTEKPAEIAPEAKNDEPATTVNETAKFTDEKQAAAAEDVADQAQIDTNVSKKTGDDADKKPDDLEQAYMNQVAGASQDEPKGDDVEKK